MSIPESPSHLGGEGANDADIQQMAMLKVTGLTAWKLLTEIVSLKPGDTIIQNAPLSAVGQYVIQLALFWAENDQPGTQSRTSNQVGQLGGNFCFIDDEHVDKVVGNTLGKRPCG